MCAAPRPPILGNGGRPTQPPPPSHPATPKGILYQRNTPKHPPRGWRREHPVPVMYQVRPPTCRIQAIAVGRTGRQKGRRAFSLKRVVSVISSRVFQRHRGYPYSRPALWNLKGGTAPLCISAHECRVWVLRARHLLIYQPSLSLAINGMRTLSHPRRPSLAPTNPPF